MFGFRGFIWTIGINMVPQSYIKVMKMGCLVLPYGAISNLVTLMDDAFFGNLEDELCASDLNLIVHVCFADFLFSFPMCLHDMITNLFRDFFMQLAQSNQELVRRGMEDYSHEVIRLQRFMAKKDEEYQDLEDDMKEL